MKVFIKTRKRQSGQFQFYMHQFVETAVRSGMPTCKDSLTGFLFKARNAYTCLIRLKHKISRSRGSVQASQQKVVLAQNAGDSKFRKVALWFYPLLHAKRKKRAVIVTSRGEALFRNAFPFFYRNEIIPMLWDVWPDSWERLYQDLKLFRCKILFVTVRSVAEKISNELGIRAYWIPEGIDPSGYQPGKPLSERSIDLYELGRQKRDYHQVLEHLDRQDLFHGYCRNTYDAEGRLLKLAFPTAASLIEGLSNVKIIVSFPQADTHPERAGGLDTLTQRYWEAMLCRCLIVGRAPAELIDLLGYDPVINVDWDNPATQLESILTNISSYQSLVDRNHSAALKLASWDSRMPDLLHYLKVNGYQ